MTQERAVKLALLDLRVLQEDLALDINLTWEDRYNVLKQALEEKLTLMYAVGFDANNMKETNGCQTPIVQLNKDKKSIRSFSGVNNASRQLNIPKSTLLSALKIGNMTRQGHYWEYKKEGVNQTPS
jgi:hypothetical protein